MSLRTFTAVAAAVALGAAPGWAQQTPSKPVAPAVSDEELIIPDVKEATNLPFFLAPLIAAGGIGSLGRILGAQRGAGRGRSTPSTPSTID